MPKIAVVSLGCAKNLVDTEIMLGQIIQAGWSLTQNFGEAEMILVNTCGFIKEAKTESLDSIMEMAEYKKPGRGVCSKLVVAGCLVQRYAQDLAREIPEVDCWIGLDGVGMVMAQIEKAGTQKAQLLAEGLTNSAKNRGLKRPGGPFLNNENLPRYQVTFPHTTYVKIAEGCDHRCSYCAIPLIKGGFQSRNPEAIVTEISTLVKAGVKEINLIAQDITRYGRDLNPPLNLKKLLEEIISRANPDWLRLLYAYPTGIDCELLEFIASQPSICKYLDLPLQHINSRILKLMNRNESPAKLRETLSLIRNQIPGISLRTTFLTGFPTETEPEFEEILALVAEGFFQHIGVFTYSAEEGTGSFAYVDDVPEKVKQERKRKILEAQRPISARKLAGLRGQKARVLIDKILTEGQAVGRTEKFAPEIDGVVYVSALESDKRGGLRAGQFIAGTVTGSDDYNLWVTI
ncbi:MAG: 30S ribosomal protein S12 methylthiotransferase RimO [Firmicutes bacterium]|nr:30S ribosomal protein S12 methylthiotransferase RimO [Bacillota bacterium]